MQRGHFFVRDRCAVPDKDQESGKDHLHFEGQAQLLAERGLVVANLGDCIEFLSHANYYRF